MRNLNNLNSFLHDINVIVENITLSDQNSIQHFINLTMFLKKLYENLIILIVNFYNSNYKDFYYVFSELELFCHLLLNKQIFTGKEKNKNDEINLFYFYVKIFNCVHDEEQKDFKQFSQSLQKFFNNINIIENINQKVTLILNYLCYSYNLDKISLRFYIFWLNFEIKFFLLYRD
jgi:hypothetical protein